MIYRNPERLPQRIGGRVEPNLIAVGHRRNECNMREDAGVTGMKMASLYQSLFEVYLARRDGQSEPWIYAKV